MSFPRYERYKDSGVEWLGEVPEHWRLVPFWTRYRRTKRIGYPEEEMLSAYRDHGVVPKASRDDNNNKASEDLNVYQLVEPGDLVINKMKAWQGSVAISDHQGIVSPAYFVYSATHKDNPRYLHYLMRSDRYITGYLSLSKGVRIGQWDLDPIYHSRIPLLMPPINEQNQIANLIDKETRKIDALIEEQRRLIELLKEKRQAVISHAVTKGLNPNAPMKDSGVEWIGTIPSHWEVGSIKRWFDTVSGGTPNTGHYDEFYTSEGGYPWIRTTDLNNSPLSEFEISISDEGIKNSACSVLPIGSVLIAMYGGPGTIGKNAVLQIDATINQALCGLLPNKYFSPSFTFSYIQFYRPHWMVTAVSSRIDPNISQDQIRNAPILRPPLQEQLEIESYLSEKLTVFDSLLREAEQTCYLLGERRSALISAAVTGKIDVRNYTPKEAA